MSDELMEYRKGWVTHRHTRFWPSTFKKAEIYHKSCVIRNNTRNIFVSVVPLEWSECDCHSDSYRKRMPAGRACILLKKTLKRWLMDLSADETFNFFTPIQQEFHSHAGFHLWPTFGSNWRPARWDVRWAWACSDTAHVHLSSAGFPPSVSHLSFKDGRQHPGQTTTVCFI